MQQLGEQPSCIERMNRALFSIILSYSVPGCVLHNTIFYIFIQIVKLRY